MSNLALQIVLLIFLGVWWASYPHDATGWSAVGLALIALALLGSVIALQVRP